MSEATNLHFEQRADRLIIRTFSRDIIERKDLTFQAIAAAIKSRGVVATLVDLRAVPGPVTFMDQYQLGEFTGRYLSHTTLAVLAREDQVDKERIGQQVARNRGASVEVFTDPAAAEAWLARPVNPVKKPKGDS